jgi:hypothetical protein
MKDYNQRITLVRKSIILLFCICIFSCSKNDTSPGGSPTYQHIPVIFHIIHNGQLVGTGTNVGSDFITTQLQKLNSNFKRLNIKIEFVLASKNPSGQSLNEPGIERIFQADTTHQSTGFFQKDWVFSSMWNPDQYINIWVCKVVDGLGRGTMPYVPTNHQLEGLIATDYYLNNPANYTEGVLLTPYLLSSSTGHPITHEMGHFFGLIHVFENACSGTDYCNDTYQYDKSGSVINYTITTCDGNSIVKNNYMDYSPAPDGQHLTSNQISRIEFVQSYAHHRPKSDSPHGRIKNPDEVVSKQNDSFQIPVRPTVYECDEK